MHVTTVQQCPELLVNLASGRALPRELQRELESFFGVSFQDVRVHVGPEPLALGARAFAAGSHLFFAPGCFQPDTAPGRHLIAHELTHVLQQRAGRVPQESLRVPTLVDEPALEAEAEHAAQAFVLGQRLPASVSAHVPQPRPSRSLVLQAAKVNLKDSTKTSSNLFSKNEYEKYLYDFKLIQTWLTDKSYFVPALKALDGELARSTDAKKKLTNILLRREQFYGINISGAPIYTDVLSGPEFVSMNRKGVLPKDHVTAEHGEFTHRLHWYIVLYNATSGFIKQPSTVFYNSVINLLKKTTMSAYKPPKAGWPTLQGTTDGYETTTFSMWEALFDRRPFAGQYSLEEDWLTCPEMFTALLVPLSVDFNKFYRDIQGTWTLRKIAPRLSAEITQRYQKRQQEIKDHGGSQASWARWYAEKKSQPVQVKIDFKPNSSELAVDIKLSNYELLEYDDKEKGKVTSKAVLVRRS
ncbi:LirA/MavJ family T4SS effector [Archangium violaceum]|uniref:LirA/MavJ family T4SS effector n=1 Tax=Archangium violaceum TaxID=83451 RepID=UPI002B28FD35|nr:LirA/MavJ family T4SS effector [Archangium gephyra]